jgi:hypothetical protein
MLWNYRLAHGLVGEPASTSPEHALDRTEHFLLNSVANAAAGLCGATEIR